MENLLISDKWIEQEAHGDEILLELLLAQDALFRRGKRRDTREIQEFDEANMRAFGSEIRLRQQILGIDPLEGPDYLPRP